MNFLNEQRCKECGGCCCQRLPGATLPEDFQEPLLESLVTAFSTGKWAVDWWEGDPTGKNKISMAYFIRPATKGNEGKIKDPSWGGECVFLTENGCILSPEDRPAGCRLLEPKPKEEACKVHGATKQKCAIAWIPYTEIIDKAITLSQGEGK